MKIGRIKDGCQLFHLGHSLCGILSKDTKIHMKSNTSLKYQHYLRYQQILIKSSRAAISVPHNSFKELSLTLLKLTWQ